jgi:hypothetical protein
MTRSTKGRSKGSSAKLCDTFRKATSIPTSILKKPEEARCRRRIASRVARGNSDRCPPAVLLS